MTETTKIILVTDDKQLGALSGNSLGDGVRVQLRTASSILDELDELEALEASILFVDSDQIPQFVGFALLRALAAQESTVPVIGMVDEDQTLDAIAFVRLGAKDVLCKPLRPSELWGTVRRFVELP